MNRCRTCGVEITGYPFCSARCASSRVTVVDSPRLRAAWEVARAAQRELDVLVGREPKETESK